MNLMEQLSLLKSGETLAKKILEVYDIVYLFLKEVLNLDENEAKSEAEKIKSTINDNTINSLAKYVHKVLDMNDLNCDYDVNKEKCRSCLRRTSNRTN